jgi:predicted ATPase/class 3 adenylate cyclase
VTSTGPATLSDPDRDLPSGLVTFVFTDIEASTRLFRHHPELYPRVLQRHRAILRTTWPAFAGVEVSTEGDGTLVAFSDAAAALRACAQAQRALVAEQWEGAVTVRVRMGIHTGPAHPWDGDYVALAVHQAARVASAAHGGQVVVSDDTARYAGALTGVRLVPLGRFRVRDFDQPVPLYQLAGEGLPTEFPSVRATPAEGNNLTRPPTTFLGREAEVESLAAAVAPGRLVSIVGPGGVGKSRLAVEVGLLVTSAWPEGVWRVDIDDLSEPETLPSTVADVLRVPIRDEDPRHELPAALSDSQLLLVLDGAERHVAAVGDLAQSLLAHSPAVGLLVTSREPLHVAGEVVRRLNPLALPQDPNDTARSPAVAVFLDRARAVDESFRLGEENRAAIVELVRRLDGLPLALEIAAGLAPAFSPEQMLTGLDEGLSSLRSRDRTLPRRQQSLEALLTWSEQLLSPSEQAVFRRLAVFAGTFTLPAARHVAAGTPVTAEEIPDDLWALVDRSLVLADTAAGGSRYRMLQLVRQFGRSRLAGAHEVTLTRARAADWLLDQVGPEDTRSREALGRIATELDNLRGLVAATSRDEPEDQQARAQLLATTVAQFHVSTQSFRGGVAEVTGMAEHLPAPTPARASLLLRLAHLLLEVGDVDAAQRHVDEAVRLHARVGLPAWEPLSIERAQGEIAIRRGDPEAAIRIATNAMGGDLEPLALARMTNMLTIAHNEAGHVAESLAAARLSLAACEALGDEVLVSAALGNVAEAALRLGDIAEAARYQRRALDVAQALGQPRTIAYSLTVAARISAADRERHGDILAASVALITRALAALEDTGQQLYPEDAEATQEVLDEGRRELGGHAYGAAQEAGRAMSLLDAVARAADILERAGSG